MNVTKNHKVTIPREMREDLKIQQGDEVFFREKQGRKLGYHEI